MNEHLFDIDVDLTELLEADDPVVVSDIWYRLARPRNGRLMALQRKAEQMLEKTILHAQWAARHRRALDRRRAIRVPLLTRVSPDCGQHLVSTNISMSGICASGMPTSPVMDIEFKIPGLDFPVDTRVEVMSFKESNVTPLVGLRFINLQRAYAEHIAGYVARRRDHLLNAA